MRLTTEELKKNMDKRRKRALVMAELRTQGKTLAETGKLHNLTRERVRQILAEFGFDKIKRPFKTYEVTCNLCHKTSTVDSTKAKRKYCNERCRFDNTPLKKPQKEFTREDWTRYYMLRSKLPSFKVSLRKYFLKNKEKIYEKNREYMIEYRKRPYVVAKTQTQEAKARINERLRERYKTDEKYKQMMLMRNRENYIKKKLLKEQKEKN